MSDWLMRVIKAEAERLIELAAEDDELRADLRTLAMSILTATEPAHSMTDTAPAPIGEGSADGPARSEPVDANAQQDALPLRELTLGRPSVSKSVSRPASSEMPRPRSTRDDLNQHEDRCRSKGDAARWTAERLRRLREGNGFPVENPPMDPEMAAWADRLADCFYWINSSETAQQRDLSLLDNVAGCFETVAEALALVRVTLPENPGNPKGLERSLPLVAEAQSGLRAALQRLGAAADSDQLEVFEWLKATAARHHVYIKRFMRADESADPARWYDLLTRIDAAAPASKLSRLASSQADRIRDRLQRLQADDAKKDDWLALFTVVDDIIGEGVPPSHRELRELLLPVIDVLPESNQLPTRFRLVLREIDRFLATRSRPARSAVVHELTAELKEAGRLVHGTSIVLIGGNRRPEAQESLRRALGLKDLIWIETKEHQAVAPFEPLIARPDVAVVLLAIRWSSHAFGDVRDLCERHGKPLVRLPGGYSPNQVATQILSQCSGQLSSEPGRPGPHAGPASRSDSGLSPG
jgi:hypothetical protein